MIKDDVDEILSDEEVNRIVPILVRNLSKKIGSENAVSNSYIRKVLLANDIKTNGIRIRSMIHYIRVHDLVPCLIANNKGCYVAENIFEVYEYDEAFKARIRKMDRARKAIIRQRKNTFGK